MTLWFAFVYMKRFRITVTWNSKTKGKLPESLGANWLIQTEFELFSVCMLVMDYHDDQMSLKCTIAAFKKYEPAV